MIKEIIATALLSANVGAQPIAQNLATTREEIVYQYQTNELNYSTIEELNSQLVSGNIYQIRFYKTGIDSSIGFPILNDTGINSEVIDYDILSPTFYGEFNCNFNTHKYFDYMTFDISILPIESNYRYEIKIASDDTEDIDSSYLSFKFTRSTFDLDLYLYVVVNFDDYNSTTPFYLDSIESNLDIMSVSACPKSKIPYSIVSTKPNNIYTYMYDFYLSLFDNTQLDSMTWTIGTQAVSMAQWLAHTLCIITIILGVVLLILLIRWLFRVFSGLIQWAR